MTPCLHPPAPTPPPAAMVTMVLSCTLAVLVNVSQFMCLGRFSAVSFQVGAARLGGCVGVMGVCGRLCWLHAAHSTNGSRSGLEARGHS